VDTQNGVAIAPEDFLKQEQNGATSQWLHHISRVELFKISGHWQKYKEDLFPVMGESEDEGFVLKAMKVPSTFKFIRVSCAPTGTANPSR